MDQKKKYENVLYIKKNISWIINGNLLYNIGQVCNNKIKDVKEE